MPNPTSGMCRSGFLLPTSVRRLKAANMDGPKEKRLVPISGDERRCLGITKIQSKVEVEVWYDISRLQARAGNWSAAHSKLAPPKLAAQAC